MLVGCFKINLITSHIYTVPIIFRTEHTQLQLPTSGWSKDGNTADLWKNLPPPSHILEE